MKLCAYCGRENEEDAVRCRECGNAEFQPRAASPSRDVIPATAAAAKEADDAAGDQFIDFKCPHCGQSAVFERTRAGTVQECPFCAQSLVVPWESSEFGQKVPLPIKTPRLVLRRLQPGDC